MKRKVQNAERASARGTEARKLACWLAQAVASTTIRIAGARPIPRRVMPKRAVAPMMRMIPSQGTYFVNIDIAPLGETDDVAFCRRLVTEHGVAAIPVSAFYAQGAVKNVVRFCFAKKDATLDAGLERLAKALRRAA